MENARQIKQQLEQDRPERWEKLPDIDLYMDQVISYLPRQSVGGKAPALTSAMINNYVKDGLLPRASGKRYRKEHLAYLTAIGLLKNVLTVKDMKLLLERELREGQEAAFYQKLLDGIDEAFDAAAVGIDPELTQPELTDMALRLALISCAAKTACEELLAILEPAEPAEDPKLKKEQEKAAKRAKSAQKE